MRPATRFLVDASTGTAVVQYLRSLGYDVVSVLEVTPTADDRDVIAQAGREQRVLITNDKDFGELVFRHGRAHYGVLLLRLQDERPFNRVQIVRAVIEQYGDRLPGRFTVATEGGVRMRSTSRP